MNTRKSNFLPMAIVTVLALGAGITGTMLWVENHPSAPAPTTQLPTPTGAPILPPGVRLPDSAPVVDAAQSNDAGAVTQGGSHEPPAQLTSGMSPSEAALTLGNWYYDHEKWNDAITNYRAAIQGGVDNPNIRTDLGNALRFSDRPQEALKQYQLAQKQDPTHEQSLFNQGALFAVSLKNPRKGTEMWQAYLKRFPNGSSAQQARELLAKFQSGQS